MFIANDNSHRIEFLTEFGTSKPKKKMINVCEKQLISDRLRACVAHAHRNYRLMLI